MYDKKYSALIMVMWSMSMFGYTSNMHTLSNKTLENIYSTSVQQIIKEQYEYDTAYHKLLKCKRNKVHTCKGTCATLQKEFHTYYHITKTNELNDLFTTFLASAREKKRRGLILPDYQQPSPYCIGSSMDTGLADMYRVRKNLAKQHYSILQSKKNSLIQKNNTLQQKNDHTLIMFYCIERNDMKIRAFNREIQSRENNHQKIIDAVLTHLWQ